MCSSDLQAAAQRWRKTGRGGSLVNIVVSPRGLHGVSHTNAARAGVMAFSEAAAIEWAEFGIRVNCILPGLIATPMAVDTRARTWKLSREQVLAERIAKIPLGCQGSAWDVANAALFLASSEAGFITGIAMTIDGGRILNRI